MLFYIIFLKLHNSIKILINLNLKIGTIISAAMNVL